MWCDRGGDRQVVIRNKGRDGTGGCTARASKTVKQIEESLLNPINHILGKFAPGTFVHEILTAANTALMEIASEPVVDVEPLRQLLSKKVASRDRLVRKLESVEDDGLLVGICSEAVELLRGKVAKGGTFGQLRKVMPMRQI